MLKSTLCIIGNYKTKTADTRNSSSRLATLSLQSYWRTLYVSPPVPPNERKIFSRYQLSAVTDWLPLRMRRLCLSTTVQGGGISWVRGSVCFELKFALPPCSPPLPSGVQISNQNLHGTFDPITNLTSVYIYCSYVWFCPFTRQSFLASKSSKS